MNKTVAYASKAFIEEELASRPRSEVETAMERATSSVNVLVAMVSSLEARLAPVLRPANPVPEQFRTVQSTNMECQLSHEIHSLGLVAEKLIDALRGIDDRLGI